MRTVLLAAGFVVSVVILLAVFRTFRLVEKALGEIRKDNNQPYARYYRQVHFPLDANILLLLVPCVVTALFGWLTLRAMGCG